MPPRRRWSDLSERTRRLVVIGATFEGVLKIIALADLVHRSSSEIRGSKAKWAAAVVLINSAGAVPIAYLAYGRRGAR